MLENIVHCKLHFSGSTSLPLNEQLKFAFLQAGAFRIGDTAGTLKNIVHCKLHRPGSVGFVSKSGGMSNEMYNVLARASDGLYEGALSACRSQRAGAARHLLGNVLQGMADQTVQKA